MRNSAQELGDVVDMERDVVIWNAFALVVLSALGMIGLMAIYLIQLNQRSSSRQDRFARRKFFADGERELYRRLVIALPTNLIFPKVAMSALLEPVDVVLKHTTHGHILLAGDRVNFIVCFGDFEVAAVVRLQSSSQTPASCREEDRILKQAGIRVLRFQSDSLPSVELLREAILRRRSVADVGNDRVKVLRVVP